MKRLAVWAVLILVALGLVALLHALSRYLPENWRALAVLATMLLFLFMAFWGPDALLRWARRRRRGQAANDDTY